MRNLPSVVLFIVIAFAGSTSRGEDTAVLRPELTTVGNAHGVMKMHARYYRAPHTKAFGPDEFPRAATPRERALYESRIDWMHEAKYGAMFCFLANLAELPPRKQWTSETWNAAVEAVDVEAFAEQCKDAGLGYVILTLGQNCQFACAPNPVIDEYWGLEPGQYNARRDLPMDLYKALHERGIRMMLYVNADSQYRLPRPEAVRGPERYARWVEALRWYSDHYGKACAGWWVDGLTDFVPGYVDDVHTALKHGNADAVIASGNYVASDFLHGHCKDWKSQQRTLPYLGRWDPEYRIQWQALQYLGKTWGHRGVAHSDAAIVNYARNIVSRGGVITFDLGTRDDQNRLVMTIPERQMQQLRLIRDALAEVPVTDGADSLAQTLQESIIKVKDDRIHVNNIWPARWSHRFTLNAPGDTTLDFRVEDGVLVELRVSPAERAADVFMSGRGPGGNLAYAQPARMLTADGRATLPPARGQHAGLGVDGDPTTGAEAAMRFGWAYEVDLGSTTTVNRITLAFHPARYATAFRVAVSTDGEAWKTVYEETDAKGAAVDAKIVNTEARYFRVIADKPDDANQSGYQMRVTEFGIYR